jgi:Ser/Thr protein kinase RdoA (MazF antagonist)
MTFCFVDVGWNVLITSDDVSAVNLVDFDHVGMPSFVYQLQVSSLVSTLT